MGNWMTVTIDGTCDASEVEALCEFLRYDWEDESTLDHFGPLAISAGLCGLGNWPAETILVGGNLAERNFDADSVARHLERCAEVAPSLAVAVHCGGDYESEECVATVRLKDGAATVGPPERERVVGASDEAMKMRLLSALSGGRL